MDEISPDLQWELDLRATEGALAEHPPEACQEGQDCLFPQASQAEITDSDAANEANCLNGDNIEYNGDFGKDSQATVAAESEITGSYNGLSQLSSQNVTPNRPGPSNTYRNVSGTETQPNTPDGPVNQHVDTSPSQDAGDGAGTLNGLQPDNGTVPCDQSTFQALWERQFSSGFQDSPTKATQVGLGINTATETQQHPPALALSSSLNTPSKGTPRAGTKRDLSTYLAGNRGATYMPNPVIPNVSLSSPIPAVPASYMGNPYRGMYPFEQQPATSYPSFRAMNGCYVPDCYGAPPSFRPTMGTTSTAPPTPDSFQTSSPRDFAASAATTSYPAMHHYPFSRSATVASYPGVNIEETKAAAELYLETAQQQLNSAFRALELLESQRSKAFSVFMQCQAPHAREVYRSIWGTYCADMRCMHDTIRDYHFISLKLLRDAFRTLIARRGDILDHKVMEREQRFETKMKQLKCHLDAFELPTYEGIRMVASRHAQLQRQKEAAAVPVARRAVSKSKRREMNGEDVLVAATQVASSP